MLSRELDAQSFAQRLRGAFQCLQRHRRALRITQAIEGGAAGALPAGRNADGSSPLEFHRAVGAVADGGPVDCRDPAVFFFGEAHNAVNEQLVQRAVIV